MTVEAEAEADAAEAEEKEAAREAREAREADAARGHTLCFALCHPYSCEEVDAKLASAEAAAAALGPGKVYFHRTVLARSLCGRPMELLTIRCAAPIRPASSLSPLCLLPLCPPLPAWQPSPHRLSLRLSRRLKAPPTASRSSPDGQTGRLDLEGLTGAEPGESLLFPGKRAAGVGGGAGGGRAAEFGPGKRLVSAAPYLVFGSGVTAAAALSSPNAPLRRGWPSLPPWQFQCRCTDTTRVKLRELFPIADLRLGEDPPRRDHGEVQPSNPGRSCDDEDRLNCCCCCCCCMSLLLGTPPHATAF